MERESDKYSCLVENWVKKALIEACLEDGAKEPDAIDCTEKILRVVAQELVSFYEYPRWEGLSKGQADHLKVIAKSAAKIAKAYASLNEDALEVIQLQSNFRPSSDKEIGWEGIQTYLQQSKTIAFYLSEWDNPNLKEASSSNDEDLLRRRAGNVRSNHLKPIAATILREWKQATGQIPSWTKSTDGEGEPAHPIYKWLFTAIEQMDVEQGIFKKTIKEDVLYSCMRELWDTKTL